MSSEGWGDISPQKFFLGWAVHCPHKPPFSWFAWVQAVTPASCQGLIIVPSLSHLLLFVFWQRTLLPKYKSGNAFKCLSSNSLIWALVLFIEIYLFLIWWAQRLLILYCSLDRGIESLKFWPRNSWADNLFITLSSVFQCFSKALQFCQCWWSI